MIINNRVIGPGQPPYIVAEISCNHNGSFDRAIDLIMAASVAGADAVKFQAYEADSITINHNGPEFTIQDGPWKGRNLHELYSRTQTPLDWFPSLFRYAKTIGITAFASVFDRGSINILESLRCPAYKIASMEITDHPLIRHATATGKPVIISTGMASEREIDEAVGIAGVDNVIGLECVSDYPAKAEDFHLGKIGHSYFIRGISDHTPGYAIPVAATALGAQMIEKHLMMHDGERTEDYEFSLTPVQFREMVRHVKAIWQAVTQPKVRRMDQPSRQLRRSLYVVMDIKAGEPFTEENVRSIRPAYGLEPGKLPWVLTKIAAVDLKRGTALNATHIS